MQARANARTCICLIILIHTNFLKFFIRNSMMLGTKGILPHDTNELLRTFTLAILVSFYYSLIVTDCLLL